MPVRVEDMRRLKLEKLLEYVDMTKEELSMFMVMEKCPTLETLADKLSEDTDICSVCGNNYIFVLDDGICDDCSDYILAHTNF